LLGEERALVTQVPGTTRDALEAEVTIDGFPIRLVDTAGLGEADDLVERLGIEVARRFVEHADLILYCVSCEREIADDEKVWLDGLSSPYVVVRTKADRGDGRPLAGLLVSSVNGGGVPELRTAIVERVFGLLRSLDDEIPVLLRSRQSEAVARAATEVAEFAATLRNGVAAEYAATHLREAESALEELVGLIESESVLDRLFATFCIGK
jgi:tRNA modification GTPase